MASLDFVKFMDPGGYGLGDAGIIFEGRDTDAFFGTLEPLTSFSFDFVDGINGFGFFGGESVFRRDLDARDGFLDLEFRTPSRHPFRDRPAPQGAARPWSQKWVRWG